MRRISKKSGDQKWLKALGKNIELLIKEKGYHSVYDFWVQKAGDHIARASLNYIVRGSTDPKASTLKLIARLLKIPMKRLFEINKKKIIDPHKGD